jgi:hypothetical protein
MHGKRNPNRKLLRAFDLPTTTPSAKSTKAMMAAMA